MPGDAATQVLSSLRGALQGEEITLGDLADTIGYHGNFTFIFLPALLVTTPLSGIPGLSSLMGVLIAITAAQILVGRSSVWLPGWLRRRSIESHRIGRALDRLDRAAGFLDRHARARFQPLVSAAARRVIALLCLLCGAAMPLLEFIPFTSSVLGAFSALLSAGVLLRDGLFVALALLPLAAGLSLLIP
jgi:hypothetical protein